MSELSDTVIVFVAVCSVLLVIEVWILLFRIAYSQVKQMSGREIGFIEYIGISSIVTSVLYTLTSLIFIVLTQKPKRTACEVSIFLCILLYATSKVQIYLFLLERSHIVNCPKIKRADSTLYKLNILLLLPYVGVLILMIIYRIGEIDDNGHCLIGLLDESSMTLLVYDTVFSVYMVALFLYPLFTNPSMKSNSMTKYAQKNLTGAVISTVSSFINILSIYLSHGKLRGHECLFYCVCDVFINVLVMNWLLGGMESCFVRSADINFSTSSGSKAVENFGKIARDDLSTQCRSQGTPTSNSHSSRFRPTPDPENGPQVESVLSVLRKMLHRSSRRMVIPSPSQEPASQRDIDFVL
mmetsp:Transcript_3166/g.4904  ORF Transcript_3166/g.4904 Transcript_3166/m.4904 type:complete len:354 (+) Transcript_3166:99-1160(+)